jgi:large subunit ribosomal protein L1
VGQKKIKLVDLSQETQTAKSGKPLDGKKETLSSQKVQKLSVAEKLAESKHSGGSTAAKKPQLKNPRPKKIRSRRYRQLRTKIDHVKFYPPAEAVKLLCKIANSKMDETVELHLNTREDKISGLISLPHGTGKKQTIAIADDKLLMQIEKGKINFDVLIATPQMMGKIAKVARILGPKGLMPNPQAGTITDRPEKAKKKLEAGQLRYKTEPKEPLMHLIMGKISFGEKKLLENLAALIKEIRPSRIKKAVLTSTHSPAIKLEIN